MKPNELLQQQGVLTGNNGQNQPKEKTAKEKFVDYIEKNKEKLKEALPKVINMNQYLHVIFNAINAKPELCECTQFSFMACVLQAATLGLEINSQTGESYIIPYFRRNPETGQGQYFAQFQIGYRGLIKLAYNNEAVKDIFASEVCENDLFRCVYGTNRTLYHEIDYTKDRGRTLGYYAQVRLKNGGEVFYYMTNAEIERHKQQYSQNSESQWSPWNTNYNEMAKKTVLRKVLKITPLNTMTAIGIGVDNNIGTENNIMKYANEVQTPQLTSSKN